MSGPSGHWLLKLLALAIALALWAVVSTRDRRSATVEATLPVVPTVVGTPAPGHRVVAVRVEPNVVVVKGRRSTIRNRDSIRTTPVDVAGRRSRVTQSVGLAFPDSVSAADGGSVQVTVDIEAPGGTALDTEGLRR